MINMQLKLDTKKTNAQLRALGLSMKNFPVEMRAIGDLSSKFFSNEVFATKGGAIGTSWPPRKAPTGSWPLLEKTGALKGAWTSTAENTSVTIFNPTDYGVYHQTGTSKMPKRKLMDFTGELPTKIHDLFVKMLQAKILRALRQG